MVLLYIIKEFAEEIISSSAVSVALCFELRMCEAPHKVYIISFSVLVIQFPCTTKHAHSQLWWSLAFVSGNNALRH